MQVNRTRSICAWILYALVLVHQGHALELNINDEREYCSVTVKDDMICLPITLANTSCCIQ